MTTTPTPSNAGHESLQTLMTTLDNAGTNIEKVVEQGIQASGVQSSFQQFLTDLHSAGIDLSDAIHNGLEALGLCNHATAQPPVATTTQNETPNP